MQAAALALLLLPSATGCYVYAPVGVQGLAPGTEVAVALTDQGRVAIGPQVGEGARRISGELLQSTDSELLLAVSSIHYVDAPQPARWAGEQVRVQREHVARVEERRLSRSRSWIAAGVAAAAVVAVSMIALVGLGGEEGSERVPNGGGNGQT